MRKLFRSHEGVIFLIILAYSAVVTWANPQGFLSLANLFDTLKSASIHGLLALGVLLIILTGGVDLSFPAVAASSAYLAVVLTRELELRWIGTTYLIAIAVGLVLGLINGLLVRLLRAPALIVTLGTSSIIYGLLLFTFGSTSIFTLPLPFRKFASASLYDAVDPALGTIGLHPVVLIWLLFCLMVALFLRYTMAGRIIYALGGNPEVCERSGVHVLGVYLTVFGIIGVVSATAGVTYSGLFRVCSPTAFQGEDLDVIAAVVLGGASIYGGRGTVLGTMLGVLLITLTKNSLILMGIPSSWQRFVVGLLLVLGVVGPILRRNWDQRCEENLRKKLAP